MKDSNLNTYKTTLLFNLLFQSLGKTKEEILNTTPGEIIFDTDLSLEIRMDIANLGCEFEDGVCVTSYLFFSRRRDIDIIKHYCDDTFVRINYYSWHYMPKYSDTQYLIRYHQIKKVRKDDKSLKVFECLADTISREVRK
ncbi:MAG: hypothetical protein LBV43_11090 [Prevotella sp.]|jgi:hypothetical protein|nr:hypothetical protein [Prevotella sp.]